MAVVFSLLTLALMIGALVDIVTRPAADVKYLPKLVWIILVALVPLVGGILWFLVGRDYGESGVSLPRFVGERTRTAPTQPSTPSAPAAPPAGYDNRSTEQQIADLDREIEEWRLRAELEKRRRAQGDPGEIADA